MAAVNQGLQYLKFQTKLTYDMICYVNSSQDFLIPGQFQTKLTYDMICYAVACSSVSPLGAFQTKLTYDMICYKIGDETEDDFIGFKLS